MLSLYWYHPLPDPFQELDDEESEDIEDLEEDTRLVAFRASSPVFLFLPSGLLTPYNLPCSISYQNDFVITVDLFNIIVIVVRTVSCYIIMILSLSHVCYVDVCHCHMHVMLICHADVCPLLYKYPIQNWTLLPALYTVCTHDATRIPEYMEFLKVPSLYPLCVVI